ncbi:Ribosome-releasing factor 2, mitochondrial [Halotydeus destructor]|nr:Ribosome-releasing factor 2, mitochondrial [Halotydeus destructor]
MMRLTRPSIWLIRGYHCRRCLSSLPKPKDIELSRIRNIGIIAHIDAGKTTTTERFLYYSGLTSSLGEVHDGDTVTDYMTQERERGITITSASVTFPWKKHRINLVDTPGHVDFTVEVERSLAVLDGAIVVLDSSAGVEAQTVTVWTQADRYKLPRIAYINKMDKATANIDLCLKSMAKLGANPVQIHLPIKSKTGQYEGLVDIISMNKMLWNQSANQDGLDYSETSLNQDIDAKLFESAIKLREDLIGKLSDFDSQLSDQVLSTDDLNSISTELIVNALRRSTIRRKVLPVLLGSSYKNVGVQVLMDNIVKLLPSPVEAKKNFVKYYQDNFCGLVFKIIHDKMHGPLTFVRVYSGQVKSQAKLYNVNREKSEKCGKILTALANEYREVTECAAGNIAVITGLLDTVTGDTLVGSSAVAEKAKAYYRDDMVAAGGNSDNDVPILAGPKILEPVFFCSIEAPSLSKQRPLEEALVKLQREDPSLRVKTEEENGQMVISGMGELHIEIIKDRLLKEYGIEAYLGPLQVSYRETISESATETTEFEKIIGGTKNHVILALTVKPSDNFDAKPKVKVVVTNENNLAKIRLDRLKAIRSGISSALDHGPLLNFPVVGVDIELHWFESTFSTTSAVISAAASACILGALGKANMALLEPLMKLEVTVPGSYGGRVLSDLSARRVLLSEVGERPGDIRVINGVVPLVELVNYSTTLRTITSGTAGLSMEFDSYCRMNDEQHKLAYARVTGFAL